MIFKIIFFSMLSFPVFAADVTAPPIDNFRQVDTGVYRGARPGSAGMKALPGLNIKTVLDLEDDSAAIDDEKNDADALHMNFISMPMSGFWTPDDSEVDQIEAILADPSRYPIFVHCQFGMYRTGVIVGLYRVSVDHWAPADAYAEMLKFGFHTELIFLKNYFDQKTGLDH